MRADEWEDVDTFEPIRDTKHGNGSIQAANKGKVKLRLYAIGSPTAKKHRKRRRR